jgi:hypothetical protein
MLAFRLKTAFILAALALCAAAPHAGANNYASAANGFIAFTHPAGGYTGAGTVGKLWPETGAIDGVGVTFRSETAFADAIVDQSGRRFALTATRPVPPCQDLEGGRWCNSVDEAVVVSAGGGKARLVGRGVPAGFVPGGSRLLVLQNYLWSYRIGQGKKGRKRVHGPPGPQSPAGDSVALNQPGNPGISLATADGSRVAQLTNPPMGFRDTPAGFSPDGLRVLFLRSPTNSGGPSDYPDIHTVRVDGTDERNLTASIPGPIYYPTFSPDGTKIAFLEGDLCYDARLIVMGSDGSQPQTLLTRDVPKCSLDWAPIFRCAGKRATIVGDDGPDTIKGTKGNDVIVGNAGRDVINGRGGKDRICGGDGPDKLLGGKGKDRLVGGPGKDGARQ